MGQQRGIGLIEVMIALLLTAVGVLGFLAMQTKALRETQEAYNFSRANLLANDLFERMRLNMEVAMAGGYAIEHGGSPPNFPNCQPCSPDQMRDRDLAQWLSYVNQQLPDASARISSVSQTLGPAIIQVELKLRSESDGQKISYSFQTRF